MKHRAVILCAVTLSLLGCMTDQQRAAGIRELELSFVVDKIYDERAVVDIFRGDDPAGLVSRARSMGVDVEIGRAIHDAKSPDAAREIAGRIIEERFTQSRADIQASRDAYQNQWMDFLPVFSGVVVETTQAPWIHSRYTCVVSSTFPGLSDWSGSTVAVRFGYDPGYQRKVLAHEIVLSQVFQLLRQRYDSSELGDWQIWGFAEITAGLILDDRRLQPFWQGIPHSAVYSGYPQLPELEAKLKELFDRRTSYRDYEDSSAAVLKSFQPFRFRSGWLGVFLRDIAGEDHAARQFARDMQLTGMQGSFIAGIYRGSPADLAGLMAGDFVISVDSTQIVSSTQLTQTIASLPAGTKIGISALRFGQACELSVIIGQRDAVDAVVQPDRLWPGFTVAHPGDTRGVVVASITDSRSPAGRAGLNPGDVVVAVNGARVDTVMDLYRALNQETGEATIFVLRAGEEVTIELVPGS